MPEKFPTHMWTRKQWQEEKDKLKVPKGAGKANIGDALDKFHKANAKGFQAGLVAVAALDKDLKIYLAAIKTKYPQFHQRVQHMLVHDVDSYLKDAPRMSAVAKTYPAKHKAATAAMRQTGAEFIAWERSQSGKFTPSAEKATLKALVEFLDVVKKMPFATDKITKASAQTFDQTVYAATGGSWNKKTIDGLMKQMGEFPGTV